MKLSAHGQVVDIRWDDEDDHISRRITQGRDFYEKALLEDCYDRAPEGLVVDAGAHIGNHTLWFAAVMGRRVCAFEPHPPSFAQLEANISRNGLEDTVSAHPVALGAVGGWCEVTEPLADANSGSRQVIYGAGSVPVVTLDSLELDVAMLKVDVEGAAPAVLVGAHFTIRAHKPLIYVECEKDRYQVEKLLAPLGYCHIGCWGATPVHGYQT